MIRPGQLLTEFMDVATKRPVGVSRVDAEALRKRLAVAAKQGVKFIGPKGAEVDTNAPMLVADLRPPYPVTVIEGEVYNDNAAASIILACDMGDHVALNFFTHLDASLRNIFDTDGEWIIAPLTCRVPYSDASIIGPQPVEMQVFLPDQGRLSLPEDDDKYDPYTHYYAGVCQILANHHVETEDVEPDAKAARSRRIRGKAPLFTYKTLVIGAPKKRKVVRGGGTHASPRSHMRRGYYRTSRNGVRHWVQACMVKGETPGFVHKDYRVQQQGEYQ